MTLDVLLVDDQEDLLKAGSRFIGIRKETKVTTALGVPAAKTYLATFRPDLIVSDYEMGAETGGDLLRYVREDLGRVTPVIIVTGRPHLAHEDPFVKKYTPLVLGKPYGPQAIQAAIDTALAQK